MNELSYILWHEVDLL